MKVSVVTVTPKQAALWLKHNNHNREVRKAYVKRLSGAMARGEWVLTHQPIAISSKGNILDGQHRLMAVVASDQTVKMLVAEHSDEKTFDAIDIGEKRSYSDIFREDKSVMSVIALIGRFIYREGAITPKELEPIYQRFIGPARLIEQAGKSALRYSRFRSTPIKVGVLANLIRGEDKNWLLESYANFANMEMELLNPYQKLLAKQLIFDKDSNFQRVPQDRQSMAVRAWLVFNRDNANVEKLMVRDKTKHMEILRDLFATHLGWNGKANGESHHVGSGR